jgi:hypothetical protein
VEGCYDPGRMADPIRLTKGVHTRDIRSSLTPGRTNRVFAALDGPPLRVLEKYPLDVLELGQSLPSGWDGGYFPSERRITVRPSVPRKHFGQAFAPGSVQFVTDAAKSETEAIQRNLGTRDWASTLGPGVAGGEALREIGVPTKPRRSG